MASDGVITHRNVDVNGYTALHVVGDLVALVDSLGQKQVFVVAHDWGALIAWSLCLFRPDRVKALVALSVAFNPRNPAVKPVDAFRALYGDDYYVCRFQKSCIYSSLDKRIVQHAAQSPTDDPIKDAPSTITDNQRSIQK
ncbi:Epoxide hydrolase 2 [Triticum urartu]|uniref:Epoxide hydrolase 2 n=1 Tax=Triticum urartu TaxID=4572 RepID=M7YX99_TRIUA|nr:Epoxide hydrolase 2 [Triticum urartu]